MVCIWLLVTAITGYYQWFSAWLFVTSVNCGVRHLGIHILLRVDIHPLLPVASSNMSSLNPLPLYRFRADGHLRFGARQAARRAVFTVVGAPHNNKADWSPFRKSTITSCPRAVSPGCRIPARPRLYHRIQHELSRFAGLYHGPTVIHPHPSMFVLKISSPSGPVTTADCGPSTDSFGLGAWPPCSVCRDDRKMIIQRCPTGLSAPPPPAAGCRVNHCSPPAISVQARLRMFPSAEYAVPAISTENGYPCATSALLRQPSICQRVKF